jgi:hypothetical protein
MPCRRTMSTSSASDAFLLPGRQPLSPSQTTARGGAAASITQPLSLLTGVASRLLGLVMPPAAAQASVAVPAPAAATGSSSSSSNSGSGAVPQPNSELVLSGAGAASDGAGAADGQAPVSSVLSLTEAGKQHTGQLVVSEVSSPLFMMAASEALCCSLWQKHTVSHIPANVRRLHRPGHGGQSTLPIRAAGGPALWDGYAAASRRRATTAGAGRQCLRAPPACRCKISCLAQLVHCGQGASPAAHVSPNVVL